MATISRLFLLTVVLHLPTAVPALADFKGDPKAAALARRMIDQMGDRQAWVRAKWTYTTERAYYASRPDLAQVDPRSDDHEDVRLAHGFRGCVRSVDGGTRPLMRM